jgi:large subunit ribosomal protein L32
MSVPKQRHTRGRRNRRRANIKIFSKRLIACSQCKKKIAQHSVCPYCGYYKGKKAIDIVSKKDKNKGKKKEK